jgi:hypothetical protein
MPGPANSTNARRPFVVASGKVTGYDLIMAKTLRGAA